jgi:hypothetical protein
MAIVKSGSNGSHRQRAKRSPSLRISSAKASAAPSLHVAQIPLKPDLVKKIIARKRAVQGVLSGFGQAVLRAEKSGRAVRMTVTVEPRATLPRVAVEEIAAQPENDLEAALVAARARGATRVADILNGADMLSADQFAEEIGATRETVHKKRQRREVLGLEGPKRGVRFPKWQLGRSGELLPGLPLLFGALGNHPWAVFRFLLNEHRELGGSTGLAALRGGRISDAVTLAETIGAGAFA